jgi:diguanylate cyclase (GGDEF) domain
MAVEQAPHRNRKINRFAVMFPFLVSTIILILTYCFAPHVLLDDELEIQPAYNYFLVCVPSINIVAVLFYTFRKARQEENSIEKRKHLYIGLFPILVIAGGLLQMFVLPNTPIFCFCCTILMLMFYIQSMETQISLDPLTKLNNREQLHRYTSQKSNLHTEGRPTFVVMIDINDFKMINDTYGHAEGDRALVLIANMLKNIVKTHSIPIFLGRYGGDEFILIVHPAKKEDLDLLVQEIRDQITAECRICSTSYLLSVGVGYDELGSSPDTFQKCIQRADQKLYLDKEYRKTHGQSTPRHV